MATEVVVVDAADLEGGDDVGQCRRAVTHKANLSIGATQLGGRLISRIRRAAVAIAAQLNSESASTSRARFQNVSVALRVKDKSVTDHLAGGRHPR